MPEIKFQIRNNVINSYKRLAYKPWYAIAEFVDNSTQSFFNHQNELLDVFNNTSGSRKRPLLIDIQYDAKKDFFSVRDTAMGMSFAELRDALRVAKQPKNTSGRSQFGMGMKTAAFWLGNEWTICTKKLGEEKEHLVKLNLSKIASGNNDLEYTWKNVDTNEHYTEIQIHKHNQIFQGRTLGKIGQFLKSMYRQDFRKNLLTLLWRGEELDWEELDKRLAVDKNGEPYKRYFNFTINTDINHDDEVEVKKVEGWIGVLARGSRQDAGFTVFHANRVIMGWPNTYRPEGIFGQERNDLLNQRLLGEIHLNNFLVSHTKDAIQWIGNEEELVERKIKKEFADYIKYAREVRKGKEDFRGPSDQEREIAISELKKELSSDETRDELMLDAPLTVDLVKQIISHTIDQVTQKSEPDLTISIDNITVYLFIENDLSPNDKYLTVDSSKRNEVIVIVNENHPHWAQLTGPEGVLNYLRHCVYDGIAEWKARNKLETIDPDTIKVIKDGYLRIPLRIENHNNSE